jgi:MFS family permease
LTSGESGYAAQSGKAGTGGMIYRRHARVLLASLVGTAVEFYDFYIYATAAALVFGPLFFPASSPSAQLLAAYASFGVAFIARPVGASLFGHFGDRIGRKSTLVASLMLMGGSTLLIAFLPTYATAGWWAPLLLCLLRFGQAWGSAASGVGRRCSRSRMRRRATAPGSACSRNWAHRSASSPPTACSWFWARCSATSSSSPGAGACRSC